MIKKIIIFSSVILFAMVQNSFALDEARIEKTKTTNIKMAMPAGKPFVKGPTSPPPSNEEILKMRGVLKEESFFEKV
jgi:hypothetical protein